jgi:hypothetical protein
MDANRLDLRDAPAVYAWGFALLGALLLAFLVYMI